MRPFIHEDILLHSAAARDLYHGFAEASRSTTTTATFRRPLILENHRFADLAEIWLGGDHYKWRAMRANGVDERFCTGSATPSEKFDAWVATVPHALRNPLYHWSHLELARYLRDPHAGICPETADEIWRQANARLATMRVHDILAANKVAVICTTDDPADSLDTHQKIAESGLKTRVYPAFRPDKALGGLAARPPSTPGSSGWPGRPRTTIRTFDDFLGALSGAPRRFPRAGGRISDHGLDTALSDPCTRAQAAAVFDAARRGQARDPGGAGAGSARDLMLEFGRWDAAARLDQAAPPRRPAQRKHPAARQARPGHGLRLDRGFSPDVAPWRATSTRSTRPASFRAWSSTT